MINLLAILTVELKKKEPKHSDFLHLTPVIKQLLTDKEVILYFIFSFYYHAVSKLKQTNK